MRVSPLRRSRVAGNLESLLLREPEDGQRLDGVGVGALEGGDGLVDSVDAMRNLVEVRSVERRQPLHAQKHTHLVSRHIGHTEPPSLVTGEIDDPSLSRGLAAYPSRAGYGRKGFVAMEGCWHDRTVAE